MIADIEEVEEMDASQIHARRPNAKEMLTPMKSDNLNFPVAGGTVKPSGGNRRLKPSTSIRDRPELGKEQESFRRESDELSSPTPLQDDSTHEDAEAKCDFLSITGDFIYRHHVERRVKLYMPKDESFPIPSKYIDVTRTTPTSLDVLLEKHIDDYWYSDAWTSFTIFILLNERPPDGYRWSRRRLTKKQTTSRPDTVCPIMWKHMSDAAKKKQSKNGPSRNRSTIMPEDYVVSSSLNQMMKTLNTP